MARVPMTAAGEESSLKSPDDPLQELARFSHREPEAVEVVEELQELGTFQRFYPVGEVATLA
jgi:hypothetical protein